MTTGLAERGVELVGTIPPGLPRLALPDLDLTGRLLGPAAGVALMAFVESIAAARAFTGPTEQEVDADQELRALGAANVAGGFSRPSRPVGDCPRRPSTTPRAPSPRSPAWPPPWSWSSPCCS